MRFFNIERRKSTRTSLINTVEFVLAQDPDVVTHSSIEKGVMMDMCDNGLSLYTSIPLIKKQRVDILRGPSPSTSKPAIVKWVRKLQFDLYKAGLVLGEI